MIRLGFLIAVLSLGLAGCVVAPPNLSVKDLQQYRIAGVTVEGAEKIQSWPREEKVFLAANTDPDIAARLPTERASTFPKVTAHFQARLNERFRAEFASFVEPILIGKRPLQAVVRIKIFNVPSTVARVLIEDRATIQLDIDLVDVASRAVVLRYEGLLQSRKLIGGLLAPVAAAMEGSDVGYSMMTDYMTAYRDWLLQN